VTLALDGLPPLREVVATHGLDPKKSLGQNFLFDLNLTRRIARAAGPLEHVVFIEVGPGPGGLTRALLSEGARKVIAIERDERCLNALTEIAGHWPGRLEVIAADALDVDYSALAVRTGAATLRICANLPYNIATPLLTRWLEYDAWPPYYDRLILMFQREVALRIVATPEQRADYGRLGVLSGWRTQARILFDVAPSAFTPPPKVTSSLVELVPRSDPPRCDAKLLASATKAAFGQRRKMLRQSLKPFATSLGVDVTKLLEAAGIEPTRRAEELDVKSFASLARAAQRIGRAH
jgi:16S rRNA (adenine1518-N6/adenine1519-N6)-dimethyltransferase